MTYSKEEIPVENAETTVSDMTVPYTENPDTAGSDTRNTAQLNKDILKKWNCEE